MNSPFRLNKKTRKRLRKQAQQCSAWADEQEISGAKSDCVISGMRRLAEYNSAMARLKRVKKNRDGREILRHNHQIHRTARQARGR